jgi:hypothetical protein
VQRLFRSIVEMTVHLDRVEVVLYVDEDDTDSHDLDSADFRVVRIVGSALSMGGYNSACLEKAQGDVLILANDDMVIRTPGWDDRISAMNAEFEDRIYLGYANDLFKKSRFCTFPILSRRTCELLVTPYPPEYRRAFIDVHLFDIFKRVQHAGFDRIRYMDDVVFEHLHYRTGKASFDETYAKRGRFAGDPTFLALINSRQKSADRLLRILRGDESKVFYSPTRGAVEKVPETLFKAIATFTRDFLFDHGLPLRWRCYLWVWFIGRYMAGRGMLRPFVR